MLQQSSLIRLKTKYNVLRVRINIKNKITALKI